MRIFFVIFFKQKNMIKMKKKEDRSKAKKEVRMTMTRREGR